MAKKQKTSAPSGSSNAAVNAALNVVGVASIDDIFAKPAKPISAPITKRMKLSEPKSSQAVASSSNLGLGDTSVLEGESKKRKKKRKDRAEVLEDEAGNEVEKPKSKTRTVETIIHTDPSARAVSTTTMPDRAVSKGKEKKRDKKDAEEDEMFRDSRGDGPSWSQRSCFVIALI
jgi:hypothetical protein